MSISARPNCLISTLSMRSVAKVSVREPTLKKLIVTSPPEVNEPRVAVAGVDDWWGKPEYYDVLNRLNGVALNAIRATGGKNLRRLVMLPGYAATATAEVSVSAKGEVKVHRMVLATNCGHAVNPQQIAAQVQGGVAYGLTALFYGENSVEKGRIKEVNFDTYPIMRMAQMPVVETVVVPTYDFWGGVGEPTICVAAPAVLNALMAATGKPARDLPLRKLGYNFT